MAARESTLTKLGMRKTTPSERLAAAPGQALFGGRFWHFEFFPAPFLFVRWDVLDLRGNPPNVGARIFNGAIALAGR